MHPICRTSLCKISDDNRLYLTENTESLRVKTELSVCVPELAIDKVINPVVCFKCVQALHSAYKFKTQCLETEKRINNYVNNTNLDTNCDFPVQMLEFSSLQSCIAPVNRTFTDPRLKPSPHDIIDDLNNLLDEALQNAPKHCEISGEKNKDVEWADDFFHQCVTEPNEITESGENQKLINLQKVTLKDCFVRCVKLSDNLIYSKHNMMSITQNTPKSNKKHRRGQGSKKQYVCTMCPYKNIYKSKLKKHIRSIHSKEKCNEKSFKQFACAICSYKGASKDNLKKHINRMHSDNRFFKPFACYMCSYKCTDKQRLNRHIKIHLTDKFSTPFPCKMCSYTGASKRNLYGHVTRIHGDKPFVCNMCPFKSTYQYLLKRHIITHHNEKAISSSDM